MPPTSKRRRRPDVTPDEKAALLAVCREIRAEEPELSVRGYIYRICDRANVYLHGDLCVRDMYPLDPPPGENGNEETIQRLLLEFRRAGLIPYESIIDGTRPTTFAEGGYDNIDEARESMAEARQRVVESYELNIWTPQGKRVEFLSGEGSPVGDRGAGHQQLSGEPHGFQGVQLRVDALPGREADRA